MKQIYIDKAATVNHNSHGEITVTQCTVFTDDDTEIIRIKAGRIPQKIGFIWKGKQYVEKHDIITAESTKFIFNLFK